MNNLNFNKSTFGRSIFDLLFEHGELNDFQQAQIFSESAIWKPKFQQCSKFVWCWGANYLMSFEGGNQKNKSDLISHKFFERYLADINEIKNCLFNKLNNNPEHSNLINTRFLYGLTCMYKAFIIFINSLFKLEDDIHLLKQMINSVDMGLLYSPPFCSHFLSKLASLIHDHLMLLCPPNLLNNKWSISQNTNFNLSKEMKLPEVDVLDIMQFHNEYFTRKIPILIKNAIKDWPALNKWSPEYFLQKAAYRLIPVEIGNRYTDTDWNQKVMTLEEYINIYLQDTSEKKGYCAQYELFENIQSLASDFYIPDYCALCDEDTPQNDQVHINAWFGPGGTISPLHTDSKDNLFAQVFGSKYIRLYPVDTPKKNLYLCKSNQLKNTSIVDVENVDNNLYPNFPVKYLECIVQPGDLLYIPKNYWHYVRSLNTCMSISFWWNGDSEK